MLAGMSTTRQHLLAWVHAHGLAALDELFREEAVALAGPKGRHQPQRTHHHWGTAATVLTFGGRRVQVRRPRVRRPAGGETALPSVATFRARDPLTERMMQQLLAGVSMRHYEGSLEARPSGRPTRGSSKSAVSRTVVRRTRRRRQEHLARRLDGLEMVALFMDGVVVAQQTVIVVLRGHDAYYGLPSNWPRLDSFHDAVRRRWYRVLRRRSQRRLTWERFNALLERFPLPSTRITHPREVSLARLG